MAFTQIDILSGIFSLIMIAIYVYVGIRIGMKSEVGRSVNSIVSGTDEYRSIKNKVRDLFPRE